MKKTSCSRLYLHWDKENQTLRTSNIYFWEWAEHLGIEQIYCVQGPRFTDKHTLVAKAELLSLRKLKKDADKITGLANGSNFIIDYPPDKDFSFDISDPYQEKPLQIMLSVLAGDGADYFYEQISNQYAFNLNDGSWHIQVHYKDEKQLFLGLKSILEVRADKKSRFYIEPLEFAKIIQPWCEGGLAIDFTKPQHQNNTISIPCWKIGIIQDHDDIWNNFKRHKQESNGQHELVFLRR